MQIFEPDADDSDITRTIREERQGHSGLVVWLTGLPAAGKSTIARQSEKRLFAAGFNAIAIDADMIRRGLCADLGFSMEDRSENVRRIAQTARILLDAGHIVIVACISPLNSDRQRAREIVGASDFFEVFVACPVEVCRQRDPKGLYASVTSGQLTGLTGIDSPYEVPDAPSLVLHTNTDSVQQSATQVDRFVHSILRTRHNQDYRKNAKGCRI